MNRYIDLDGTYNFRDMGGYLGHDNKKVRMSKLYRADSLSKLSNKDIKRLVELDINIIVDYRSEEERYNNEDVIIPGSKHYVLDPIANIAVFAGSGKGDLALENLDEELVSKFFREENAKFVESERGQAVYRKLIDLALANQEGALVHHCSAGKDRTGYGAALILLLLGVSEVDVYHDYLMTNENLLNKPMALTDLDKEDQALMDAIKLFEGVKPEYLSSAINIINDKYAGPINYAINQLGLSESDIEQLRKMYLI